MPTPSNLLDRLPNPPRCFTFLGLQIDQADPGRGYCRLTTDAAEKFCNPAGVIQGGILAAMLDDAMAIAAVVAHDFKKVVPTLDMKLNYLKPVFPEALVVEGEVVKTGRNIVFMSGRLYDPRGALCVIASATAQLKAIGG